eukprot:CAMPEP_0115257804 /NCGR_PEP_ID=MMETSP0270-20121206/46964_1 /TAXON_ID=71861 /ORGANISM="Scrippsiella trochoidea, Strain CCMP3099" /LENGTH=174 /DNA_ID=CAMNT_0002673527 /DNA_START=55 /DNA_END=579 /DNA_ORIENTATION=+
MFRASLIALSIGFASANSMHLGKLCRGQTCDNPAFPIMDYAAGENKCVCRAHPCWDDNGAAHSCVGEDAPFLTFSYDKDLKLSCGCSSLPFYASTYIVKDLCPGHYCESRDHSVLDYDEAEGKCICRVHPCHDMDGMKHECNDPKFPILRYREDESKPICECAAKMERPVSDEL